MALAFGLFIPDTYSTPLHFFDESGIDFASFRPVIIPIFLLDVSSSSCSSVENRVIEG
jgi:hypothetical protein